MNKYFRKSWKRKFKNKFKEYLTNAIIIHQEDLKEENGILYMPIYMTELL